MLHLAEIVELIVSSYHFLNGALTHRERNNEHAISLTILRNELLIA